MKREKRMITGRVETRALTDDEKASGYIGVLVGHIPLNSDSVALRDRRLNNGQPFVERIASKAFSGASDVMAMAGHTEETLSAFARQGVNLTITETADELRYDALIPNTSAGRDLMELSAKQIVRGTSFEFELGAVDKWEKRSDGTTVRTVERGTLLTVNPVIWPAYDSSELTVSMRGQRGAGEERGTYLKPELGGLCDYYDPTLTPDTKFACAALSRANYALTDALEYLRAAPAGAMADYARAEVTASAASAKVLVDWLAANGAAVNPALQERAAELLKEARSSLSQADHDRERRFRILTLGSR